ncbi:hypothetical protein C2G38_2028730 [Gigaspora rosea]|uniref:Uncharacterized protein n=1 Tax=Gigaspora rosea TaxID=44941 RepID=A0A397W1Y7_9GLOM|nr:hypothetical protein C2G38_2028730 [Gigaspora rosea]
MWTSTSLTGIDKLKVLQNFNLDLLFLNKSRAQLIRQLWNGFNELYEDMHKQRINGIEFKKKALEWINLFLTPSSGNPNHPQTFVRGLYRPNDITPYIHTLVYHIPEFLNLHSNFGLIGFSCSAVEKKNHQHVVHFFRKTLKDGGGENINKSAIIEIMEWENRNLYFFSHDVPVFFEKITTINVKDMQ